MEEECRFDFDVEIMDQYAEQSLDFDDYSEGVELESYDP